MGDDGRVRRPESAGDTVSEGQAYTMLRAVWMGDRETFDRCYAWTERNLSRVAGSDGSGDALLAWHWADGRVTDRMSASDADLDYALALVFAGSVWGEGPPAAGQPGYWDRARDILTAILEKETAVMPDGRRVLLPWIQAPGEARVLNPGYFSPAHFKIFFQFTGDRRWIDLVDSSYEILSELSAGLGGVRGPGLIPDWVELHPDGRLTASDRSRDFGWDAVRSPFRVGWDHLWFGEPRAKRLFDGGMADFLAGEMENGSIKAGYGYQGERLRRYEDPVFYAAAYFVFRAARPELAEAAADRVLSFLRRRRSGWVYRNAGRYFTNSLSWMAEADRQGMLKNLYQRD